MVNDKLITLYTGLILLVTSLSLFYIGYHNVDICSNLIWINAEYKLNLVETNHLGNIIYPIKCYKDGLGLLNLGLLLSVFGSFLIGRNLQWKN